jgi:ferritin
MSWTAGASSPRLPGMITPKMLQALNGQIRDEMSSAYLYLAMSAWCDAKAFKGFSKWLRVQHEEELDHVRKLVDYVIDRGGEVTLDAIPAPRKEFGSMLQVFEAVLEHERGVTVAVNKLYDLSVSERDPASQVFLQWYVSEQVEEEASVSEIVEKIRMVGDRAGTLLYLDKEYGKRTKG